jgi:hypothetical protein
MKTITELEHDGFSIASNTPESTLREQLAQPDPPTPDGKPAAPASRRADAGGPGRPDADAQPVDGPDEADPAARPDEKPAEAKPDKKKPEGRVAELRAEINQLTREKHTIAGETARERAERERLQAEINDLRKEHERLSKGAEKPAAGGDDPPAEKPARAAEPQEDDFEDFRTFLKAHSTWTREQAKLDAQELIAERETQARETEAQRTKREEEERQQAQSREVFAKHQERVKTYTTEHPEFATLMEKAGDLPTNAAIDAHVLHSKYGPRLMHYFAENPEECERVAALGWGPALVEIGAIEATFRAEEKSQQARGAKSGSPSAPVPRTKAAPPISPVGGDASVADADDDEDLSTMEFGPRYVELMNQREQAHNRRQRRL